MAMEVLLRYFPALTDRQQEQFAALGSLYPEWNARINVISRKDIDNLYEHHILHSLAIAKAVMFRAGTSVLDLGTGGGFPGIPLAILFPDSRFRLIDGTGKKIRVAAEIASAIGLTNVEAGQRRGEEEHERFEFVVSRAVMPLPDLVRLVRKNISSTQKNALPNGLLCLKGGNLEGETTPFRRIVQTYQLSQWFSEPWFREKQLIYIPL